MCPIDGSVDVGFEDIDSVIVRDTDRADLTFVCPHCGTAITVTAIIPSFLLAAMEALSDDPEAAATTGLVVVSGAEPQTEADTVIDSDDPRFEAYCEYFRRQLQGVESVDDALAEIDSVEADRAR